MRKTMMYGALLTLTLGTGVGAAMAGTSSTQTATSPASSNQQLSQQIQSLQSRAVAAHDTQLATALGSMNTAVQAQHPSTCPPSSQAGRQGKDGPPCGIDHLGILPACPAGSSNAGNPPPCSTNGQGKGPGNGNGGNGGSTGGSSGGGTTTPAACGPAPAGSPAAGPISGPVYGIGAQISAGGGAPLGDAVQQIACAVYTNLGL